MSDLEEELEKPKLVREECSQIIGEAQLKDIGLPEYNDNPKELFDYIKKRKLNKTQRCALADKFGLLTLDQYDIEGFLEVKILFPGYRKQFLNYRVQIEHPNYNTENNCFIFEPLSISGKIQLNAYLIESVRQTGTWTSRGKNKDDKYYIETDFYVEVDENGMIKCLTHDNDFYGIGRDRILETIVYTEEKRDGYWVGEYKTNSRKDYIEWAVDFLNDGFDWLIYGDRDDDL